VIKIVALIKRRPDLTVEEFRDYYAHRHAPLFRRAIPPEVSDAITHYVQNHAVALGSTGTDAPYDCVTEIGFDDLDGMRLWSRWYLGDEGTVLRDDEEHFMDVGRRVVIVSEAVDLWE
jgi:EthD domain-containing protein